jgi:anti-sigma factor RsiW
MTISQAETTRISELLPFYVNGTLDPAEQSEVEAALNDERDLNEEVQTLALLRENMQNLDVGSTPGEFGLARLMRDIDRIETPKVREPFFLKGLAVAAATAVLVVGIGWVIQPQSDTFVQASGDAPTEALTVAFQSEATQSEISAILLDLGLEVAGGPSALGLYSLVATDGGDLAQLADALRGKTAVVESVDLP